MINDVELKRLARHQLNGKWMSGVLITVISLVVAVPAALMGFIPIIGYAIAILITAPILIGMLTAYLNFVKYGGQPEVNDLFKGFENYGKSIGICLIYSILVMLWSLLLFIPGIVKAVAYSQSMFIIAENPNIGAVDAIKLSSKITRGYKLDIFIMYFSFFGWALLCAFTLGLGYLLLAPYMNTSFANLYLRLKQSSIRNGVCSENEFRGYISSN